MNLSVEGNRTYLYTAQHSVTRALRTVLFLHGAANDHSVWNLQSRYFGYHGWNALAVDLPGHGRSEGSPIDRIEDLSQWSIKLLDALGIECAALVGHSMGSLIALQAASAHADRVDKIALIGTAVPMPVSKALLDTSAANDHAALDMINVWGHSPAAQMGCNSNPGVWMMGNYLRLIERAAPGVLHADFQACNGYTDGLAAAERVNCPALLILGQRDLMTTAKAAREVAGKIKGSTTVVLDNTGHALMAEQPDAVLDALRAFL
jgi:pimeloyl-ACP methyl ester carboxylesterase